MKRTKILFLLYALVISQLAFATACPKKDALRAAIDASYRLPATTNDLIAQLTEARDRGIITVEQARRFGDIINPLARAEVVFVGLVKAANNVATRIDFLNTKAARTANDNAELVSLKAELQTKVSGLKAFFDVELLGPFLQVLQAAQILTGDQVQLILLAITAVRLILRTIGSGIGSKRIDALNAVRLNLTSNNWSYV